MRRKKQCKNKVKNLAQKNIVQDVNSNMVNDKLDTIWKDTDEIKKIRKSKLL